jgi:hypothetical protein
MPAGVKPPQCVGVKGKSGRKSAPVEFAKAQAIIRAWNKVMESVDSSDVEKVALPLALKDMASKVAGPNGEALQPLLVKFLDGTENNNNSDRVQKSI